jgi:hypothetical protein
LSFTVSIPVANVPAAEAALVALYPGSVNHFSVPLKPAGSGETDATRACLHHLANDPVFRAHCAALPGVIITDGATLVVDFPDHCTENALEWEDPTNWYQNPVMTNDEREQGGITYRSLIDWNVWPVTFLTYWEPLGVGIPAWVQPTGAHDAYPLNFIVSHLGLNYRSTIPANTTVPGENIIFGWWVVVP